MCIEWITLPNFDEKRPLFFKAKGAFLMGVPLDDNSICPSLRLLLVDNPLPCNYKI